MVKHANDSTSSFATHSLAVPWSCLPLPLTALLYHDDVVLLSTPATCSHNPLVKPLLYVAADFKVILLSIYNYLYSFTWYMESNITNTVPGLHLLAKNSVRCLSVLAPFDWALLLSMFDDGCKTGLCHSPGSLFPNLEPGSPSWCWLEYYLPFTLYTPSTYTCTMPHFHLYTMNLSSMLWTI